MIYRNCLFLFLFLLAGCGVYKQNIMFRTDTQRLPKDLATSVAEAEKNYIIQKNDYLDIRLYANKGEKLIDFNIQGAGSSGSAAPGGATQATQGPRFLVQQDGYVRLPMLGNIKLENLTLQQADSVLEKAFTPFYVDAFVKTKFANKRVFVLGGNKGQVIPLENENMNLVEVLALSGGVDNNARVRNIRLIRGDLNNPVVYLVNLSTIEGMMQSQLKVQANDIIYVEPVRKLLPETISDIAPVIGLFSSLISIVTLISIISKQ